MFESISVVRNFPSLIGLDGICLHQWLRPGDWDWSSSNRSSTLTLGVDSSVHADSSSLMEWGRMDTGEPATVSLCSVQKCLIHRVKENTHRRQHRSVFRVDLKGTVEIWIQGSLHWRIPWMEEPGRLQIMGSHKVKHRGVHVHVHTHRSDLYKHMIHFTSTDGTNTTITAPNLTKHFWVCLRPKLSDRTSLDYECLLLYNQRVPLLSNKSQCSMKPISTSILSVLSRKDIQNFF